MHQLWHEDGQPSVTKGLSSAGIIIVLLKIIFSGITVQIGADQSFTLEQMDLVGAAAILAACFGAVQGRKWVVGEKK